MRTHCWTRAPVCPSSHRAGNDSSPYQYPLTGVCGSPPAIPNAYYTQEEHTIYREDDMVAYKCKALYKLSSAQDGNINMLTCQRTVGGKSDWIGSRSKCELDTILGMLKFKMNWGGNCNVPKETCQCIITLPVVALIILQICDEWH